ncbi:MAG: hypothetical protein HOM16_02565, partial [Woeseia sp.]|nr:hypothetical protein [Woeseia sp.]
MTTEANWSDFASMDGDRMVSAANQLLPRWIALALVVGIAWQLAAVIWLLMPSSQISDRLITPPTQIARTANSGTTSIDAQLIANTHLFGEADPAEIVAAVPQESHENLAETRLNLSLKGTIASLEESTSIAIIADNRNEEKNYSIKDTVAPGATL